MIANRGLIGALFLLGCASALIGCLQFWYRAMLHGRVFTGFYALERGLISIAALCMAGAFTLLSPALRTASLTPWLGLGALAIGIGLIVMVEVRGVLAQRAAKSGDTPAWVTACTALSVALMLVGQALYGLAIVQSGLFPGWVGWLALIWGVCWLVAVFRFSARNPYYPALYYVVPLVLGVALVR